MTLDELNKLGDQIAALRNAKDAKKAELDNINKELSGYEFQFIEALQENNMDKYYLPGYGTVSINRRFTYKVPKDQDARDRFFTYLKAKGVYEDMITVHSQTLNSWTKKELEIAVDEGQSDFQVPGLGDPVLFESLRVRKA